VTRSYYRGAAAVILVYDITQWVHIGVVMPFPESNHLKITTARRRSTFVNLSRWLADCRALASPHLVVVLVGNKLDREEDREVEYLEGLRWAEENSP
jgi:GTPase SAR1 family protein